MLALILLAVMTNRSHAQQAVADDWSLATPADVGLSATRLQALEEAIRSDEFKKITSVVIARHGKLAYERYFGDFNASSLMDPRSASKTVTSMAVGLALCYRSGELPLILADATTFGRARTLGMLGPASLTEIFWHGFFPLAAHRLPIRRHGHAPILLDKIGNQRAATISHSGNCRRSASRAADLMIASISPGKRASRSLRRSFR